MPDNFEVSAGTGTTVATDLIGGAHYQRIKLAVGADGVAADMDSTHPVYVSNLTQGYAAAVTFGRTADTNTYTARDVLGSATGSTAAITFASVGPGAGEVMITSVSMEKDATTVISGETNYELHLYNVTPPSALGDNAAWDLASGDRASYLGFITLPTIQDLVSTAYVEQNGINKQITLASSSLYAYLVTVGGYVPASGTVYKVTLHTMGL